MDINNSLIIQFGYQTHGTSSSTITFPTSFKTRNCCSIDADARTSYYSNWQANTVITTKTLSSFKIAYSNHGDGSYWIAIGY